MLPTTTVFYLHMLKHGVEYGNHDQVALHQPATAVGCPQRISDFLLCQVQQRKVKTVVSLDFHVNNYVPQFALGGKLTMDVH